MNRTINTYFKDFISGYSIEVIPSSAAKIKSFAAVLPKNTRVYIAHIQKEDISAMVATAKRLHDEGFDVSSWVINAIINCCSPATGFMR